MSRLKRIAQGFLIVHGLITVLAVLAGFSILGLGLFFSDDPYANYPQFLLEWVGIIVGCAAPFAVSVSLYTKQRYGLTVIISATVSIAAIAYFGGIKLQHFFENATFDNPSATRFVCPVGKYGDQEALVIGSDKTLTSETKSNGSITTQVGLGIVDPVHKTVVTELTPTELTQCKNSDQKSISQVYQIKQSF